MNKFLNKLFSSLRGDRRQRKGRFVGRQRTCDDAITYRMRAGFPGDVNRTHPASIEPTLIDASAPPTLYGEPVLVDATTQGVRPPAAGDGSASTVTFYGVTVRPYPIQQQAATNYGATGALGAAVAPPTSGEIDVLRSGYIMSQLNSGAGAAVKGAQVYVWCAATTTGHIQGQLETAASSTNTAPITGATFNGGADANGVVEICFNV